MKKPKTQQEKDKEPTKISPADLLKEIAKAEGIISAIGDGVSILDRTFTILYENQIHRDLTGDHVGEKCYKAYQKGQRICGGCPVALTFKEGKVHTVQRELQTDQGIRYMEITASPLKDSEGKIIAGIEVVRDITYRKQAEEALRESESRYKILTESSGVGIWHITLDGYTIYLNPAMCAILEVEKAEELEGLTYHSFFTPKSLVVMEHEHDKRPSGTQSQYEVEIIGKKGKRSNVVISGAPIFGSDGKLNSLIGTFTDITHRKQAEEELRKSERILSSSFKALDGLLIILDKDFRVVMSNWKDHDFVPEEVRSGHPYCYEVFKQLQSPCDYCPPRDTFNDGKFRIYEDKNPVDESYKEISVSPVLDETGKVTMVIQHVRDITERKRSEQALKETEQKLRNIIEHSNELYYVHDTNHALSYVSPQSLQILGYTPHEMMIEWTKLATDNPINKKGVEITEKALKTGERQGLYLLELYKKDRSKVLLEIDESPMKDEQRNVIGIVGAARDVTKRVKAEDALKKSEKHIHMLLDSTAEGIYGIDLEGNCTFVNAACLRMLGYDDENELIGKNMHNMIHYKHPDGSPYPAEECRIFRAHKENKRIHDDTEVFWHKNGSSFPIEYRSFPIEEQGAVIGAVITFLDITERKQEEELEDMRTEQKLLNKEALLHIMKLNIQNPEELWKFMTLMGSQILGVDRVSIWFINNMHSEFICDALYILTKHSHEKGFKIQVKHWPQYVVALSESRILPIENALADKRTIELSENYLKPFGIISKMDVPVLRLGEVIGIISFEHTKERGWTYEDQDFAISLSHIITASLENFDRTRAEGSLRNSEKELKKRVKELEEFYEMAVGRELRIRDLKEQIEELEAKLTKNKTQ